MPESALPPVMKDLRWRSWFLDLNLQYIAWVEGTCHHTKVQPLLI